MKIEVEEWAVFNTRTQTYLVAWTQDDGPVIEGYHVAMRTSHPDEVRVLHRTFDVTDVTGQHRSPFET